MYLVVCAPGLIIIIIIIIKNSGNFKIPGYCQDNSPSAFLYRAMCRLRLWDRVIRRTMTTNLRLTEYDIAFYLPCDRRSYEIYHNRSEVSLIYKSTLCGSGII